MSLTQGTAQSVKALVKVQDAQPVAAMLPTVEMGHLLPRRQGLIARIRTDVSSAQMDISCAIRIIAEFTPMSSAAVKVVQAWEDC
jgi:hypothetical protein